MHNVNFKFFSYGAGSTSNQMGVIMVKKTTFFFILSILILVGYFNNNVLANFSLDDSLVGYYQFNFNADDSSGYGNDGNVIGAILTEDRFDNAQSAYMFSGEDGGIVIPNSFSLSVANFQDGYTIGAWIKPFETTTYYYVIVSKGNNVFSIRLNRANLEACHHHSSGTSCRVIGEVSTNKWSHVAVTWNGSTGEWVGYLNGESEGNTTNFPDLVASSDGDVSIGRDSWHDRWYFNGSIDDVRIYNRALSQIEIQKLNNRNITPAILSDNLDFFIPKIEYIDPDGNGWSFWGDFELLGQDQDGNWLWKLNDAGENN